MSGGHIPRQGTTNTDLAGTNMDCRCSACVQKRADFEKDLPRQDVLAPLVKPPITDDEVGHLVVVLRRGGFGPEPLSLHLADETVAHDVATVLSEFGPTWLIPLYDRDAQRYRPGCADCGG